MEQKKMDYSIVITTFDKRFEKFLIPLIRSIKRERNEVEIIITANGSARAPFNENYRATLLSFLASQRNCFPIVFPNFQSLAKMWNRGILTASRDRVLVLNDDLHIPADIGGGFFAEFEQALQRQPGTFKINGSFSHYVIDKSELIDVGFSMNDCWDLEKKMEISSGATTKNSGEKSHQSRCLISITSTLTSQTMAIPRASVLQPSSIETTSKTSSTRKCFSVAIAACSTSALKSR